MTDEPAMRARTEHDLKNQLGTVLGFTELLLRECPEDDPRRADLEETHKAASTALALVNQLSLSAGHGRPTSR